MRKREKIEKSWIGAHHERQRAAARFLEERGD
jgi:hypothetical protein